MNFSKTFLAGLLAFVVGNILIGMIWSLFVMGIVGALSVSTGISDNSILKIDLSENLLDAPSNDPFAGVDFKTMTVTPQVTLFSALRAIDAAKAAGVTAVIASDITTIEYAHRIGLEGLSGLRGWSVFLRLGLWLRLGGLGLPGLARILCGRGLGLALDRLAAVETEPCAIGQLLAALLALHGTLLVILARPLTLA